MKFNNSSSMKLLYTMEYFVKYTDKDHPAIAPDVFSYIAERGIFLDRTTVYRTIKFLNEFGIQIQKIGKAYYYVPSEGDIFHAFTNGES